MYKAVTPRVAKTVPEGKFPKPFNFLKISIVSLMYDGILLTNRLRWKSMNLEFLSVGDPHEDMIGLPGYPGL